MIRVVLAHTVQRRRQIRNILKARASAAAATRFRCEPTAAAPRVFATRPAAITLGSKNPEGDRDPPAPAAGQEPTATNLTSAFSAPLRFNSL
jgi:hypothetical protein